MDYRNQDNCMLIEELREKVRKLECELQCKISANQQMEQCYERTNQKVYELQKQLEDDRKRYEKTLSEVLHSESQYKAKLDEACCRCRVLEKEIENKNCTMQQMQRALEKAECNNQELTRTICEEKVAKEEAQRNAECLDRENHKKACQITEYERNMEDLCQKCRNMQQQIENYGRLEMQIDCIVKCFMDKTVQFGSKYGTYSCAGYNECSNRYEDFEKRLDTVACIANAEPEEKRQLECYKQDNMNKEREIGELRCALQQEQVHNAELQKRTRELQGQMDEICNRLACREQQLDQSQKMVVQQEAQICDLSQVKRMYEQCQSNSKCMQDKLFAQERQLCEEQQTSARCRESLCEVQRNCRSMVEELRGKDDYINIICMQVKKQECEIRSLNDKLRELQCSNCPTFPRPV